MVWGSSGVNYDINEAWEFTQRYGYIPGLVRSSSGEITDILSNNLKLSNGLEFILDATTAPMYEQRKRLFSRKMKGSYPFLPGLLQWIFLGEVRDTTPLKEYTFRQAKRLQIPEVPEPQSGPADVWRWSNLELDSDQFFGVSIAVSCTHGAM